MASSRQGSSPLGALALFCASLVWGASFIFQKTSIQHMSPLVFNGLRYLLGALVLLPVVMLADRFGGNGKMALWGELRTPAARRFLVVGGVINGLLMGGATMLQHYGMTYTTAGKAGFITALYILMVPLLGLLQGKRIGRLLCGCVLLGFLGSYLLCGDIGGKVNIGDALVLLSAVGFAVQILATDHYAPHTDCIRLSVMEFTVAGLFSLLVAAVTRQPFSMHGLQMALGAMLYCGIMSSGVGYTLQNVGQ